MTEQKQRPKYEMAIFSAKPMFLQIEQGDEARWNKELVFALQSIRSSEVLQRCPSESIMNAIVNLATIGISLNPALALAYLVPRGGKCVLDISYRGMVRIATDSGSVLDVDATVVHSRDEFYYEMGLDPKLVHRPHLGSDAGEMTHVYAVAVLHNGVKKFIVLNRKEIEKIKATSKAKAGPWVDWEAEMWRKTAVKKLYKLLPQTDRMSEAIAAVNEHEGLNEKQGKASDIASRFEEPIEVFHQPADNVCPNCGAAITGEKCESCAPM